jgi:CubicO group peptidase (beta-lactamase class C family)
LTFGWLVGEIIQRVTGSSFREFLATELAEPLGLDGCFIGTPTAEFHRVARLIRPANNDLARDPAELVRLAKDLGFEIHPRSSLAPCRPSRSGCPPRKR